MGIFDFLKGKKEETHVATILPHQIYDSGSLELKDVIAPSALKVTPKGINLGEKVVRSFFVISYPRYLSESWFAPIINLDKVFDVGIFIQPIETSQVLRTFQKKVAEVQSQINTREAKGLVRNPMLDTAYQDLENLRDQLQQAQERLFDVGLYLTIYADSDGELDKVESEIKSILEAKLVYVKPALFQQEQGFKTTIPLGTDDLKVYSKLNSSPLSSLFPFISFDLTSDKGILYGINRHNSSLILFDRFSLENYNSITFAKSGAGKSVRGIEPVIIRKNGQIEFKQIGSLIEKTIKEKGKVKIDKEMEGTIDPGFEVWSFDSELKGSWSKVTIAARKQAPNTFYRFQTQSGREITTTGDHNMLVLRDGKVVVLKSTEVKNGEYIPLPREVSFSQNTQIKLNLFDLLKNQKRMYVVGGANIVNSVHKAYSRETINPRYDHYLPLYKKGRRIPLEFFNALMKKYDKKLTERESASLKIMSGSGRGSLPATFRVNEDFGTLLGYIGAEGCINQNAIQVSNIDEKVRSVVQKACKNLGVLCYPAPKDIVISDRPFVALIYAIGASGRSAKKHVPEILFGSPKEVISAYIRAYFEGDGGVDASRVTATSKSKNLLSEISYLLLGFGIVARLHKKTITYKKTGGKRLFWIISISGQENLTIFRDKIGFATPQKQEALKSICDKQNNTNVDIIPSVASLINELRVYFDSQLHNIPNLSALSHGVYNPGREELYKLVVSVEERINRFKKIEKTMKLMSELPEIETLINLGESNKEFNNRLYSELGSSWAWMKKRKGKPGLANIIILSRVVLGTETGNEILVATKRIHQSFLDFDSSIIDQNPGLGSAFRKKLPDRTSYEMVLDSAKFISETYRNIYANLPHIEGILKMLRRLAQSDLMWDPIISIEKRNNNAEKYVYDLTVDNEIFLAGTSGMFVHNSFMTKLEILRTLMFDVDVIVIDPEKEYEYLSEAVGGRYFNISLNSEHHINPFELPQPGEGESFANVLRSNIINLVGLFRIMMGGITPEEDAIIDRAITETYALKDITPDSDFQNIEPPLMSDFELVLSGMEGGDSLAQRLTKYTRGTWAGFINKPSNVDINKKFIVFSVRDMEDELKPIAMYIVMHYIWNMIRKKLKKRLLVIDEAWWMMKSEDTASFLLSLAKRGRKYYLGLATITQDVDDFMKSPYGVPIITNSSIQVLLKQSPTSMDKLQQTFNLTDEEKYLLLESDVGEGIFFAGLKHVAIKIIASYTEEQIITSDPSEILAIKSKKEELERNG
ncbi:MAG: LAGLIDADG family homing endonuclease [Minisyncoccia bacterium]